MESTTTTSDDTPLRRSNRIRSEPANFLHEQEQNLIQRQLAFGYQYGLEEPDTYEVDSDTEDDDYCDIPSSDDEKEEKKEEKLEIKDDGWSTEAKQHTSPPFSLQSGLTRCSNQCSTPLEFFRLFISESLVLQFVQATNQYANHKYNNNWTNTTREEMNRFIAAIIYMGIYPHPTLQSYWSADARSPFVTRLFPNRERFLRLNRCFYIATGQRDTTDAIWHVRPLVAALTTSFPKQFNPPQILVIDESMVPCKARSKLKQYIKAKPYKWGYKVWCLASGGYLIQFIIYQGKRASQDNERPHEVVTRLVKPYYGLNHIVVMDGLFSSPTLFNELLSHSTYAIGTVRPNRKEFATTLVTEVAKLSRGEWRFRQKAKMVAYLFVDRSPVYFLSTCCYPSQTTTLSRRLRTGETQTYTVPTVVTSYNSARSGVDTLDQLQSYYSMGRKNRRWWPRLAWWLIDMCILNSYQLFKLKTKQKISSLEFREQLMHELAGESKQPFGDITNKRQKTDNNNSDRHLIIESNKANDCKYCSDRSVHRKRTKFKCETCNVSLCVTPCFKLYHIDR